MHEHSPGSGVALPKAVFNASSGKRERLRRCREMEPIAFENAPHPLYGSGRTSAARPPSVGSPSRPTLLTQLRPLASRRSARRLRSANAPALAGSSYWVDKRIAQVQRSPTLVTRSASLDSCARTSRAPFDQLGTFGTTCARGSSCPRRTDARGVVHAGDSSSRRASLHRRGDPAHPTVRNSPRRPAFPHYFEMQKTDGVDTRSTSA
jgi:hypothetical protein